MGAEVTVQSLVIPLHTARCRERIAFAVPLTLTLVAYLPSLQNGFVYDDQYMIRGNPYIGEWSFIWKSLVRDVWWFADPLHLPKSLYYRPLENAWLALNYHLFGTNPLGWHASMIAVELIGVWLVFVLARALTRSLAAAAVAATLFGVIPIHANAISWGRSLPLPMSAEFEMSALLCFMGRARGARRVRGAALSQYAGALLTYESAVIFALYVFLFEDSTKPDFDSRRNSAGFSVWVSLQAAAPFAAVIVIYGMIRLWIFGFHVPVRSETHGARSSVR